MSYNGWLTDTKTIAKNGQITYQSKTFVKIVYCLLQLFNCLLQLQKHLRGIPKLYSYKISEKIHDFSNKPQ